MIELVPVVEMEGWSYSDRPLPNTGSRFEDPPAWQAYHQSCLAYAGVTGITMVVPGSALVRVAELDERALALLAAHQLEKDDLPPPGKLDGDADEYAREYIGDLCGGLVLSVNGTVIAEPACCGGLDSIEGWARALASADWDEPWIGHDLRRVQARADGDRIWLRSAAWGSDSWSEPVVVARADGERAMAAAREQLARLAERLTTVLPNIYDARWRTAIARRFAGHR